MHLPISTEQDTEHIISTGACPFCSHEGLDQSVNLCLPVSLDFSECILGASRKSSDYARTVNVSLSLC